MFLTHLRKTRTLQKDLTETQAKLQEVRGKFNDDLNKEKEQHYQTKNELKNIKNLYKKYLEDIEKSYREISSKLKEKPKNITALTRALLKFKYFQVIVSPMEKTIIDKIAKELDIKDKQE